MSLLTSVNDESQNISQFIPAAYTSGGARMIATAAPEGVVRIAPATTGGSAGGAFLRGGTGATGLILGANDTLNSQVVLTNTPSARINLNSDTRISVPGTGLDVANSMIAIAGAPGAATLDTYVNRDIHGYSDTGYVEETETRVGGGVVPNPVPLPEGLYSVMVVPQGAGNEAAQASAVCYWDGAVWTGNGVSFNFTAGAPNVAIGPAAGGATLTVGGASIPAGNLDVVFRQLLAAATI